VGGEGSGQEPMTKICPVEWQWVCYGLEASTRGSLDLKEHTGMSRMNGNGPPEVSRRVPGGSKLCV
jgi:hypothetical protein